MTEQKFTLNLEINGGLGTLSWSGAATPDALAEAVSLAADDAILGREVLRVEAQIPATDQMARKALQQAGFRREGIRRNAFLVADQWVDVYVYARLASDQVYGPGGFSAVMNTVLPTKRVIGHVVFTDQQGRVLLLETSYKTDFELPGGVVEPGEPPRIGAQREVSEELGIELELGEAVLVDWMPPHLGWGDAVEFLYDGGTLTPDTVATWTLGEPEIVAAHWLYPSDLDAKVSPLSARRIRLVLARPAGEVHITEDGRRL